MRNTGAVLFAFVLTGCIISPFREPLPGPVMTADHAIRVAMYRCDDWRASNRNLWNAKLENDIWHVTYDGQGEAMRKNRVAGYEAEVRKSDGTLLKCDAILYL